MTKPHRPQTNPQALIGAEIRRYREAAGYDSQTAFAAKMGFGQEFLSRIELGKRAPNTIHLVTMAELLDVDFVIGPDTPVFAGMPQRTPRDLPNAQQLVALAGLLGINFVIGPETVVFPPRRLASTPG